MKSMLASLVLLTLAGGFYFLEIRPNYFSGKSSKAGGIDEQMTSKDNMLNSATSTDYISAPTAKPQLAPDQLDANGHTTNTNNIIFASNGRQTAPKSSSAASSRPSSKDSLETLGKFLNDPSNDGRSLQNAIAIIGVKGRDDPKAAKMLMDFAQQPIRWVLWNGDALSSRDQVLAKARALDYLGMTGTPEAKDFLLKALSNEGAHELAKAWFHDIPTFSTHYTDESRVFGLFQGAAALGLAYYSEDPRVRSLIEEADKRANQGQTSARGMTGDAVARMNLVSAQGVDAYLASIHQRGETAVMSEAIRNDRAQNRRQP